MSHKGRCPWDSVESKKGDSETVLTQEKVPVRQCSNVERCQSWVRQEFSKMLGAHHTSDFQSHGRMSLLPSKRGTNADTNVFGTFSLCFDIWMKTLRAQEATAWFPMVRIDPSLAASSKRRQMLCSCFFLQPRQIKLSACTARLREQHNQWNTGSTVERNCTVNIDDILNNFKGSCLKVSDEEWALFAVTDGKQLNSFYVWEKGQVWDVQHSNSFSWPIRTIVIVIEVHSWRDDAIVFRRWVNVDKWRESPTVVGVKMHPDQLQEDWLCWLEESSSEEDCQSAKEEEVRKHH